MKRKLTKFRCAQCGRRLPQDRYVFSRHTGERYCYEGECKKAKKKAR